MKNQWNCGGDGDEGADYSFEVRKPLIPNALDLLAYPIIPFVYLGKGLQGVANFSRRIFDGLCEKTFSGMGGSGEDNLD